ncbi:MAG: hypothetical protein JWO86_3925 [Myxococcaceae bacterium]|nr:hypothetical protein [Myxococcaceae bacterium]
MPPRPTPPPAPAAEPAPVTPPPPQHEDAHHLPVRFYGMIKPTLVISTKAAESFGNPNEGAITAAGNPVLAPLHATPRATFHVAQSRFGFQLNEKGHFRGHVEIDFYDATKSTPTVTAVPRVRIVTVDWVPCDEFTLSVGQDWDLHAPLNPYTINLVGLSFFSGNTAFMRQQIKAIVKTSAVELAAAVGIQAPNTTAIDNAVEISHFPTFAVRAAALVGKTGRIGVSGLATRITFAQGLPTERTAGGLAGAAFADVTPYDALNVRLEGYIGRNQNNLGMLALGLGALAADADELGGFASARHVIVKGHAIYATAGFAQMLNPSEVTPGYALPAPGAAAVSNGAPGMRWNLSGRLAYEFDPTEAVAIIAEGFVFQSRHVLQPIDQPRFDSTQLAPGVEAGLVYTF